MEYREAHTEAVARLLRALHAGAEIDGAMVEAAVAAIMAGSATPAQIGAMLMGLALRGETAEMVAGAARAMRAASRPVRPKRRGLLDTCGTGGDGAGTFNISTAVALVVAACGQPVAKHGNRAISSRSGSADVLEALGVDLALTPEQVARCIDETGIGFMFAPGHHPAMKHAAGPRRELGVRTIFNLLGPLTNPARAEFQVVGVYGADRLELMAQALARLGVRRALVVHGRDGLDEITTTDVTDAVLVEEGQLRPFEIDPAAFGVARAAPAALRGGDATANAALIERILAGERGPAREIVLLNAGAALWVCTRAEGIADGIAQAAAAIDDGRAQAQLARLVAFSNEAAGA
ncbi:MAG: anthranilate phosphoribosyltransferase [Zetaproteobacteria bacterium]|nr:MAG: anthranilate phosphoribosyltransferase [Zetaproteobacteria bacterium]